MSMTIDYSALLFDPIYAELGVSAMLTTTSGIVQITVIDKTRAKSNVTDLLETHSVGPGVRVRIPELMAKGVDRSEYIGSLLAFNGQTWVIRNAEPLGSPNGEEQ